MSKRALVPLLVSIIFWSALACALALRFDYDTYLARATPKPEGDRIIDNQQYNQLADSIIHGVHYLELDVPDWLANMDNPYDAGERRRLAIEHGQPYRFDYAFYHGKYQCYFGVVPALLTFVPYKLLTGEDLRTDFACALFSVLAVISCALFVWRLLKRYWPDATVTQLLVFHGFLVTVTGVLTQAFIPFFYALPPLSGLSFMLLGLSSWLCAKAPDGQLRKGRLVGGATLVALTLGCRPQMFLSVLLAFPLFWDEIVHERNFFSRKGLANTVCVMLPCLLVALPLMAYNYARFSSAFDFGASYNLTGFDMTAKAAKGFSKRTAAVSLYYYLFIPPNLKRTFPFVGAIEEPSFTHGIAIEPFHGGLVWCAPLAWGIALLPVVYKRMAKGTFLLTLVCLAIAVPLMIISPQVASISMRYFTDFAWALAIPTMCVWMTILNAQNPLRARVAHIVFYLAALAGMAFCIWTLLCPDRYHAFNVTSPQFYEFVRSWFEAT